MSEIQDSNDNIINELMKLNKRLDRIHSWLAAFIVISVVFYIMTILFIALPF
jgi:hypothetical protein